MSDEPGRASKTIKAMDETEWEAMMRHVSARKESVASFAARAFRQLREREEGVPQYIPPAAGQTVKANQGANRGANLAGPLPIENVAELAALMHGVAAMASAAGLKVPEAHAREALRLARLTFGQARDALPRRPQPEALRLANERRRQAARERRA